MISIMQQLGVDKRIKNRYFEIIDIILSVMSKLDAALAAKTSGSRRSLRSRWVRSGSPSVLCVFFFYVKSCQQPDTLHAHRVE